MFDISFTELLVIVVLAVVFIGPKEFPVVIRACARFFYHLKNLWHEIKGAMDEIARETGVDDIKRELEEEYQHDMKLIEGDDGQMYEAFDLDTLDADPILNPPKPSKEIGSD